MSKRFSEWNSQLVEVLCVIDPDSPDFLDVQKVKRLLGLTTTVFGVVFCRSILFYILKTALSLPRISGPPSCNATLSLLPTCQLWSVHFKHGVTFGASSATEHREHVFSRHRWSMLHPGEACVLQLVFEGDLTKTMSGKRVEGWLDHEVQQAIKEDATRLRKANKEFWWFCFLIIARCIRYYFSSIM